MLISVHLLHTYAVDRKPLPYGLLKESKFVYTRRKQEAVITTKSHALWSCKTVKLGFPGDSVVKNLPAIQETQDPSLGREDPLEEGMATHPSILAWRVPWTEEPGRPQFIGLQRFGHDRRDRAHTHTHTHRVSSSWVARFCEVHGSLERCREDTVSLYTC